MNLTVELGQRFRDVSFPNATATDFSDVTLVNQSHVSGDMFPVGVTTIVSFVFEDKSSNRGECSFPITVDAGMYLKSEQRAMLMPMIGCPRKYSTPTEFFNSTPDEILYLNLTLM